MGRKIKIKKAIGFISVLLIFSGSNYGCYSRDVAPQMINIYGQNNKARPLTAKELRKFAGTIRNVDGEAVAHYKMALYFQERGRHKLAIDELKQVVKRDPANAKAYNAIGVSCDDLGDNDAAIGYYHQALQIDPKLDYVYNNLGYSYLLKNDLQNAVESFQQAIALNDKEKRYSNNLGLAYARQGKYETAYNQFKSRDSDANAEKMLAGVMKDLGKAVEIEPVLLAVKNPAPQTEILAKASVAAEVKTESPDNPAVVIDNTPARQTREEILVAAAQPLSLPPDSHAGIKREDAKSDSFSAAANVQPSERVNPAPETRIIQIHDIQVLGPASSTQPGVSPAACTRAAAMEIGIAVENGNGVRGAAGKVAAHLRRNGFKVVKVSDAKSFAHFSTKVFYDAGNLKEAQRMLRAIPNGPESAELFLMKNSGNPIRLLIGRDLVKKETALALGIDPAEIIAASAADMSKPPNLKKKKA